MFKVRTMKKEYSIKNLNDLLLFLNWLSMAKIEFEVARCVK